VGSCVQHEIGKIRMRELKDESMGTVRAAP
jgi:hypothetical protein